MGSQADGADRDDLAETRDFAARARDMDAGERDTAARDRDDASAERDTDAHHRDQALRQAMADQRLHNEGSDDGEAGHEQALLDREIALSAARWARDALIGSLDAAQRDRWEAAEDRRASRRDRARNEEDRAMAASDRQGADDDRLASASDRDQADIDANLAVDTGSPQAP